jgi:hypothetical protein
VVKSAHMQEARGFEGEKITNAECLRGRKGVGPSIVPYLVSLLH